MANIWLMTLLLLIELAAAVMQDVEW